MADVWCNIETLIVAVCCDRKAAMCHCALLTRNALQSLASQVLLILHCYVLLMCSCNIYRVVQKNGATLHFPKYLENY